ncbi:MAG: hypothetical protein Q9165_001400 [Trypethelium subeluteriae]
MAILARLDPTQTSLHLIVAKYIHSLGQAGSSILEVYDRSARDGRISVLSEPDLALLQKRGYSVSDVKAWSSILLSRSDLYASRRLSLLQGTARKIKAPEPPIFLVLFLLRRQYISAKALKYLLLHVWKRHDMFARYHLKHREDEETSEPTLASNISAARRYRNAMLEQRSSNFLIITRLVRHALRVWPAAVVNVASLATKLLEGDTSGDLDEAGTKLSDEQIAHLSNLYNRLLWLLSHPSSISKYSSTTFQQRAQFDLVRHMAEHRPPLTITQEGYRGIVRVQLAQAKTHQEQDWANLKSKTWPPWKEDKTGLDAEKGVEYSMTRALMAIRRMQEAGYNTTAWEDLVTIFAGWDTDGTPTIQYRFLVRPPPEVVKQSAQSEDDRLQVQIWAARIRATRTVREAWACFLSWREQNSSRRAAIHAAMLEKLVYEEKRRRLDAGAAVSSTGASQANGTQKRTSEKLPLPGDGREVHPPPVSPLETIYLASEPPSAEKFFNAMIKNNVLVPDASLALVMDSASSLQQALSYLQKTWQGSTFRDLLTPSKGRSMNSKWSKTIFTSLIRAYCRFSHECPYTLPSSAGTHLDSIDGWTLERQQSFLHAVQLLEELKLQYRPAWNVALDCLRVEKKFTAPEAYGTQTSAVNRVISFSVARRLFDSMRRIGLDADSTAFLSLCVITEHAIIASFKIMTKEGELSSSARVNEKALPGRALDVTDEIISEGSYYLQNIFVSLVGGTSGSDRSNGSAETEREGQGASGDHQEALQIVTNYQISVNSLSPSIPRLLNTPSPATLHAFVRALGLAKDFDTLRNLTRWMVDHKPELDNQVRGARNGRRQLRNTIIALAIFLEKSSFRVKAEELQQAAIQCKTLIEGVGDEWDGWPSEQEIEAYLVPRGKPGADEWLQFFTTEPLRRVVRLIACFGVEGVKSGHQGRRMVLPCAEQENSAFWQCYLGGDVFPDVRSLELDHFWKSPSDRTDSIFDAACAWNPRHGDYHRLSSASFRPLGALPTPMLLQHQYRLTTPRGHCNLDYRLSGLQNLHHLSLTYMAELDIYAFTKVLLGGSVQAHNLRTLELKHIRLPLDLLGPLLNRCLPLLRGLTLHTPSDCHPWWTSSPSSAGQPAHHYRIKSNLAFDHPAHHYPTKNKLDVAHICPLLRDLGRNLHILDLAIPSACNELFISPRERDVLREAGVYLAPHGTTPPTEPPAPAMSLAAAAAVMNMNATTATSISSSSSSDDTNRTTTTSRPAVDTPHLRATLLAYRARDIDIQRAAHQRAHPDAPSHAFDVARRDRLAAIRAAGMRRRVVLWARPCTGLGGWDEMVCEADLEEEGLVWEMVCVPLRRASRHVGGAEVGTPLEMSEVLGGEVDELLGGRGGEGGWSVRRY